MYAGRDSEMVVVAASGTASFAWGGECGFSFIHAIGVDDQRVGCGLPVYLPRRPGRGSLTGGTCGCWGVRAPDAALSALRILSGVIGVSSIRTPMALKTALAMAGGTGLSGPCPASLP